MADPVRPSAVAPRVIDRFFEFSLLGMLAAGYFAVAGSGYLDWPTATLTLMGLCLRGLMVAGVVEFHFSNRLVALVDARSIFVFFRSIIFSFLARSSGRWCTWCVFWRC